MNTATTTHNVKKKNSLPYIPFYTEWISILNDIPSEEYGILLKCIFGYFMGEHVIDDVPQGSIHAFKLIASAIDRAEANRKKNAEKYMYSAGKKIPRPTSQEICTKNAHKSDTYAQSKSKNIAHQPTLQEFAPPTPEEARDYFKSRGFLSNPDEFISFYSAVGWKRGPAQITDWKAAAEGWEFCYKKKKPEAGKENSAPQKPRYGNFDAHEAFKRAVERTRREAMEDEEE